MLRKNFRYREYGVHGLVLLVFLHITLALSLTGC